MSKVSGFASCLAFMLPPIIGADVLVNTRLHQAETIDKDEKVELDLTTFFESFPGDGPMATFTFTIAELDSIREVKTGILFGDNGAVLLDDSGNPIPDLSETSSVVEIQTFATQSETPYEHLLQVGPEDYVWSSHEVTFQLLPTESPISVANFLTYLRNGEYENTIVHHSETASQILTTAGITEVNNFPLLIAGGWKVNEASSFVLDSVEQMIPINLEAGLDNTAGTLAGDRTSGLSTTTSSFRINLQDNSGFFGNSYSVFGTIVDEEQLELLSTLATTPLYERTFLLGSSAFFRLPLYAPDHREPDNYVKFDSVTSANGDASGVSYNWGFTVEEPTDDQQANRDPFLISISDNKLVIERDNTKTGQVFIEVTGSKAGMEDASFQILLTAYNEAALDAFPASVVNLEGWLFNSWLDWIYADQYPYVYHTEHGWLIFGASNPDEGYYFLDQNLGSSGSWVYTSALIYPNLYIYSSGEWVFYIEGSGTEGNDRTFFLYSTGEEVPGSSL